MKKISSENIALIFTCPECNKIVFLEGHPLLDNINHQSDYGQNYTGEVHFNLYCKHCDNYFVWET